MDINQQKAAECINGPLIIVAGPGAGKTKTLVARIEHIIAAKAAAPRQILALTFTKKAAEEMRHRLSGVGGVAVSTFHALCAQLLGGERALVSEPERLGIIKNIVKTHTRDVGLQISLFKNGALQDDHIAEIASHYNNALADLGKIDFDDLLLRARDMLRADPDRRPDFRYILVDEFQDTNTLQYELLQLLRRTDNVCVIGDPNQSIYGFRGASGDIFQTFAADFPSYQQIVLDTNYRSARAIVNVSNAIFGSTQHAARAEVGEASVVKVLNEYSEARWVLDEIQACIGGADLLRASHADKRRSLRDFAILYRSRSAAMALQKAVADSGLPYQVVGEGSPYERADVQKLIALMRNLTGEPTDVAGFRPTQIQALLPKVTASAPADVARQLAEVFAVELNPAVDHFIGTLVRFQSVTDALRTIDEIAAQQFYDPTAEAITLLTIHAAKGLEFPHVFLIAAEQGILPHDKADVQEEKRLFYVAVTRARDQLHITHATKRGGHPAQVSQFVSAIPDPVLPKSTDPALQSDTRKAQKRAAKSAQTSLF